MQSTLARLQRRRGLGLLVPTGNTTCKRVLNPVPYRALDAVWYRMKGVNQETDRLTYLRPSGLLGYVGLVKLQVIDLGVDRVPFDGAKPIKGDDPEDEIGDS